MAKALSRTLQEVYKTGEIPEYWKYVTIVPVYKKGAVNDPGNYRGIAIINTAQKILCKILAGRISFVN